MVAHDRGVDLAADIAGDEAERGPRSRGKDDGRMPTTSDSARHRSAGQHIAAQFVGAERIVWRTDYGAGRRIIEP